MKEITEINTFLKKDKQVVFVILFGSRATEKSIENSDIDLAIFLDCNSDTERFEKKCFLNSKLSAITKRKVDVVILNDVQNNYLLLDILKEGKVILNKDEDLHFKFETEKIHAVHDFLSRPQYA